MQMRQTQKGRELWQRVANWIRGRGARHRRVNRGKDADQTRRLCSSFAAAAAAGGELEDGKNSGREAHEDRRRKLMMSLCLHPRDPSSSRACMCCRANLMKEPHARDAAAAADRELKNSARHKTEREKGKSTGNHKGNTPPERERKGKLGSCLSCCTSL